MLCEYSHTKSESLAHPVNGGQGCGQQWKAEDKPS